MTDRMKFMLEWEKRWEEGEGHVNVAELCREFGVSRKTGYKWRGRWDPGDPNSLVDWSRRPHEHPFRTLPETEDLIVEYRKKRPTWGPKKLHHVLTRTYSIGVPSIATMGRILKRRGLVRPRKRRRSTTPRFSAPFGGCRAPNDTWCADFKGHFQTGRTRCYPLTLTDGYSRTILRVEGLRKPRTGQVRTVFESAFSEFGLPKAIRTDNGPPFSSPTVGGLSQLSVWWMRLGIRPERIEPGHPEQNGRHERMHRTLKAETASPPAKSMRAQQRRFDEFRRIFNEERPHEALDFATPMSVYERSPRLLPAHLPRVEYELGPFIYRLPPTGILSWRGQNLYISTCLAHQDVALEGLEDDVWRVVFVDTELGRIDKDPQGRYRFTRAQRVSPMS